MCQKYEWFHPAVYNMTIIGMVNTACGDTRYLYPLGKKWFKQVYTRYLRAN